MQDDTDFIQNTDYAITHDIKYGLRGGFQGSFGTADFSIYPRYLLRDETSDGKKIEFDRVYIAMKLKMTPTHILSQNKIDKGFLFSIFFHLIVDEIFMTEYKASSSNEDIGHYFGNYDVVLGIEFGSLTPQNKTILPMLFGLSIVERFNFQDIGDDNPTKFGNGQGYFGLDTSTLSAGDAFPGFISNSHIVSFYSKQLFFNSIELGESLSVEVNPVGYAFYVELYVSTKI